jgi:hypothetical protein
LVPKKHATLNRFFKEILKMKRLVTEVERDGLDKLIGEEVVLFCAVYIYAGKLIGVNNTCVALQDAKIVYETGAFSDKTWKDAQPLPSKEWFVQLGMVESFAAVAK